VTDTPTSPRYDVRLEFPFAGAVHPHAADAVPRHLSWMQTMRLLPDQDAVNRYLHWRSPELAARWYPHTVGDGLDVGLDLFGWLLVLDDSFDPLDITPDQAVDRIDRLVKVLDRRTETAARGADPIETAFADLWTREQQLMSPDWCRRAKNNWKDYLRSYIAETANRHQQVTLHVDAYLRLRDKTGIMYPLLDAAERIGGYELPDRLTAATEFRRMRDACVWVCNIAQDLLSFDREEANGDLHNLVFVLEKQQSCTRQHAIDQICTMIDQKVQQFQHARHEFPVLCDELAVSTDTRWAADQFTFHMQAAMRATYDWCRVSPRYQRQAAQ
jgi:Terpene synthase family 2, C-terminal metal binding